MSKSKGKNKLLSAGGGEMPAPSTVAKVTAEDRERQRRYAAEDAIRTLTRADEIKADKRLMSDVRKCAKEQIKTVSKVAGVK